MLHCFIHHLPLKSHHAIQFSVPECFHCCLKLHVCRTENFKSMSGLDKINFLCLVFSVLVWRTSSETYSIILILLFVLLLAILQDCFLTFYNYSYVLCNEVNCKEMWASNPTFYIWHRYNRALYQKCLKQPLKPLKPLKLQKIKHWSLLILPWTS